MIGDKMSIPRTELTILYNEIYHHVMSFHIMRGETQDKASRLANIYAVKNTWSTYNENKSQWI